LRFASLALDPRKSGFARLARIQVPISGKPEIGGLVPLALKKRSLQFGTRWT
jgi:hypothetical protein